LDLYFETYSKARDCRYNELMIDKIIFISEHFQSEKDFDNIRKRCRCTKVKSHLIIDKKSKNDVVEIIRVLHEKIDVTNIIK
jgi:toxin ParE1/3/4